MSHHFDTPTAKEDPRINVCDFYLFRGRPGTTVMALTVNPNAGVGAPDTFRDEGLYAFRFDTNRDLREDVAFKVQFGAPTHADGGEHRHVQTVAVRRATGAETCDTMKAPRPKMRGWRVCRMHGARGEAPEGKRNGNYRHGARSKETIALRKLIKAMK
jgi:hypothetical protein